MAERNVTINIRENGAEVTKSKMMGLDKSFNTVIASIGGMIGGIYALKKGFDFLAGSTKAALEQEAIFKKLENAVNLTEKAWADAKPELDALFASLQATTKYGDTESAAVFQQLTTLTGDYEKSLKGLPIVLDMAASGLFDTSSAARYVGMALGGNIEMLGRYLPEFKAANNEALRTMDVNQKAAYAIEILTEKFGGLAKSDLLSNPGKIKQFTNYWGDFREMIGDRLTPALGRVAEAGTIAIKSLMNLERSVRAGTRITGDFVSGQNREILALESSRVKFNLVSKELNDLAQKKNKTTYETQRYSQLLDLLNSQYGDYLPNLIDEKTAYDDLAASLGTAKTALMNFSKERIQVLQIADIQEQIAQAQNEFDKFNYYLEQYNLGNLAPQNMIDIQEWRRQRIEAESELNGLYSRLEDIQNTPVALEPLFTIRMPELDLPAFKIEEFQLEIEDVEVKADEDIDHKIENEIFDRINKVIQITPEMKLEDRKSELEGYMDKLRTWRELGLDVSGELSSTFDEYFDTLKSLYGEDSEEYLAAIEMKRQADENYLDWKKQKYIESHETELQLLDGYLDYSGNVIETMLNSEMTAAEKKKAIAKGFTDTAISLTLDLAKEAIKEQIIMAGVSKAAQAAAVIESQITGTAIASAYAVPAALASLASFGANAVAAQAGIAATVGLTQGLVFAEQGYEGWVNQPTVFVTGEKNKREYVSITPQGQTRSDDGVERKLDRLINVLQNKKMSVIVQGKVIGEVEISEMAEVGDIIRQVN